METQIQISLSALHLNTLHVIQPRVRKKKFYIVYRNRVES